MGLSAADLPTDALQAVTGRLEAAPVTLGLLFGSQATGDAAPGSDIDIAVEYEADLKALADVHLRLVADLTRALGRDDIDVIRLSSVDPRVAVEALEHGQLLVGTAEEADRLRDQLEAEREMRAAEVADRIDAAEDRIERRLQHREHG